MLSNRHFCLTALSYHYSITLTSDCFFNLLDIQQITEHLQCTICLVCKYTFCKYFTKLYTFLVKAVHIPYKSLEHNFILKVCKKCTERSRIYLLSDNDA